MRIYMNVKYKDMHIHNKIKSVNSEKQNRFHRVLYDGGRGD